MGTPAQLGSFLHSVRTGIIKPRHRARICFDLDRSLLTIRSGNPHNGRPSIRQIERNVRLMQVRLEQGGREKVALQSCLLSSFAVLSSVLGKTRARNETVQQPTHFCVEHVRRERLRWGFLYIMHTNAIIGLSSRYSTYLDTPHCCFNCRSPCF